MTDQRFPWGTGRAPAYPQCTEPWHDMFHHQARAATRAAAWLVLTHPEERTA